MNIESFNYSIDGEGQNLLLLHPIGLDLTFFEPLVEELKSLYCVLRIDMRGYGGTPRAHDDVDPSLQDYASDVHAMLHRLNFTPTAVAGFSMGGMIAQELALNYPADVSALVISACASTFNEETRKSLLERGRTVARDGMQVAIESTMDRWFSAGFRSKGGDQPARQRLLSNDVESWRQGWEAIAELNTAPRLSSIEIPTLCLAAERDLSVPPSVMETMAKTIPGAEFAVIPDTPHMIFIEKPKEVSRAIGEFLEKVMPAR